MGGTEQPRQQRTRHDHRPAPRRNRHRRLPPPEHRRRNATLPRRATHSGTCVDRDRPDLDHRLATASDPKHHDRLNQPLPLGSPALQRQQPSQRHRRAQCGLNRLRLRLLRAVWKTGDRVTIRVQPPDRRIRSPNRVPGQAPGPLLSHRAYLDGLGRGDVEVAAQLVRGGARGTDDRFSMDLGVPVEQAASGSMGYSGLRSRWQGAFDDSHAYRGRDCACVQRTPLIAKTDMGDPRYAALSYEGKGIDR